MTDTPHHRTAPPGLEARLQAMDPAREPGVRWLEIDGVPCIVKRRRPGVARGVSYAIRYARAFAIGVTCKIALGEFPPPNLLLRNGLPYEAERLKFLSQAGCAVPNIWFEGPGVLALEHVGDNVALLLRAAPQPERLRLARALAEDLAVFHARGFWHGGAQVRNQTMRDGELWRIDFEENIGGALSLPLSQAYDVFQLLLSLMAMRHVSDADMREIGPVVLKTYFARHADADVRAQLTRLGRMVCRITDALRPVLGRVQWRDVKGFYRVADTLRLLLKS